MDLTRTRIGIEDREAALNALVGLGFRPCGHGLSLLLYDDLTRSGTGVTARIEELTVILTTDRHASQHDLAMTKKATSLLRCRTPIRGSTHEG